MLEDGNISAWKFAHLFAKRRIFGYLFALRKHASSVFVTSLIGLGSNPYSWPTFLTPHEFFAVSV